MHTTSFAEAHTPARWHGVVIQVAWLIGALALPPRYWPITTSSRLQLLHAAQHLHLLIADVLGIQAHLHACMHCMLMRCLGSVHQCACCPAFCHRDTASC